MASPSDSFNPDDVTAFAQQFQQAADQGGFNPFALISGQRTFLGVFLAPFTAQMDAQRNEFLAHGTGPLTQVALQLQQQGLEEMQAQEHAKAMLQAAQGMLVAVLMDDQGLVPVQQFFFGSLDDDYCKHAVELTGSDFPDTDGLRACLIGLRSLAESGKTWPALFVAPDMSEDAADFWSDLAERLMESIDGGLFANVGNRLTDLAFWTTHALRMVHEGSDEDLDGDILFACARCAALGGDALGACFWLHALLQEFEPEDEALAVLLQDIVTCGIKAKESQAVLDVFQACDDDLKEILGGCYELELPRFQAHIAAQADLPLVLQAAERLQKADKKSFRHDLNKEAIWQVAVAEPGELLDTQDAADALDRSTNFVAKRLEQGALPFFHDGEQLRIPAKSLQVWQEVMKVYSLLD